MMTASHSSLSLCEKLDEVIPKCLGDQVPNNDTPVPVPIPSGNFDCSICLELPHDPVVTMCGHLFCWPCLHRWITIQPVFQGCPVCKACVKDKIIPLYGRGKVGSASTDTKLDSPRRPSAQQSYVPAANLPRSTGFQHQSFISQETHGNRGGHSTGYQHQSFILQEAHGNRGGQSPYSVTASGLFPALFGIHMITSPGGSSFGASSNAPSRLLTVGSTTPQQQRLNAQQESVLYWFLFLLGCFASACFLLF